MRTAAETLSALKLIDGEGSGLDADTLRGFTPDQLAPKQALAPAISGCTERTQEFVVQADSCLPFGNCTVDVFCMPAELVTGGGCTTPIFGTEPAQLRDSGPSGQGWHCTFGDTDNSQTLKASAICCTPTSTVSPLRVLDGNDAIVGALIGVLPDGDDVALVARRAGADLHILEVTEDGFHPHGTVYYQSNDCSGSPLLRGSFVFAVPHPLVVDMPIVGTTLYYSLGPVSEIQTNSTRYSLGLGSNCSGGTLQPDGSCCQPFGNSDNKVRASVATLDLSTLGLSPPFRVDGP